MGMFKQKRPNLSWLFTLLCIGYFPIFSMYSVDDTQINKTYDLEELRGAFHKILGMQPEFIKLDSAESQYNDVNGIYRLVPYYQKISTEQLTSKDSRFIIHKHVISGQWQLTEFDSYPLSKIIKALPVTEENEKNALLNNHFSKYNEIQELKKKLFNVKMEVKSKNDTIESLTNENKVLVSFVHKQRRQLAKQIQIEKELELKLIHKENSCFDLEERLIAKEKEFSNLSKIQNEKLIEKENEICNIYKTQTELKSTLIQKQNQICDLKNKIQTHEKLKSEQNETNQEKTKLLQIENSSKILKLQNKHWKKIEKSKEDLKLLEKEKRMSNQELLKYQKLNAKLESEKFHLKEKETILEDMINYQETRFQQLTEKLQNIDKIILETLPTNGFKKLRDSQYREKKENLNKNESQIEKNQKFFKLKEHANTQNVKNNIISKNNEDTKGKEKLQKYEPSQIEKINNQFIQSDNNMKKQILKTETITSDIKFLGTKTLKRKTIKLSKEETQIKKEIGKEQNIILKIFQTLTGIFDMHPCLCILILFNIIIGVTNYAQSGSVYSNNNFF